MEFQFGVTLIAPVLSHPDDQFMSEIAVDNSGNIYFCSAVVSGVCKSSDLWGQVHL